MSETEQRRRHDALDRAVRQTCRSLLNCYIRELAGEAPGLFSVDARTGAYELAFPASGVSLSGTMRYSPMGEHDYDSCRVKGGCPLTDGELAGWIAKEARERIGGITDEMEEEFAKRVADSRDNIALFVRERGSARIVDYLSSEQSLLFGHPFHPYPKNTIGFSNADVMRYAPELRASFRLCYFAVRKHAYREEWLAGVRRIGHPRGALDRAREAFGGDASDHGLLPVHPWQYGRLLSLPAIRRSIREGVLVPLGGCGPIAYPTSSVRTAYVPDMNCNLKLPLDIRITNLTRNNTREQMRRTMDAAAYLRLAGCFADEPHTFVASEEGVQGCALGDEALESLLTVAYRPVAFDPASTYVLASLVEAPIADEPPRLGRVMERDEAERWLRRYLDISLLPLARIADSRGIHFEAHLQNSLVVVRDGMPESFIVRDLEGVSVERDLALPGADVGGPLFYSREQARARTVYYFVVNHLGSLLRAIARDMGADESRLWAIAREKLEQQRNATGNEFARYLLSADAFPAKRNLASCLAGHGETPSYAAVRNPMTSKESENSEARHQYR
ncbi:IucA/IucC family protein [Cohnella sp. GCM10027633]|uniref:IucA/IucC family protein n=1 Tax=unclassified Cohnella TaxID=2636738 RepID=UPI00362DF5B1